MPAAAQKVLSPERAARVANLAQAGLDLNPPPPLPASLPLWADLRKLGSELWLDTGDLDAAAPLYTSDFTALTTNNTLLNKEVQKGLYDEVITSAAKEFADLDPQLKVIELAFLLNARHGLRLVHRFGGMVSVELHTDLANDLDRSLHYARRYHAISPKHFIVKLPLTPAGLMATRTLTSEGIAVNFTLGFSARQNHLAAAFSTPAYVNVFLGRINAYIADNKLGDGENAGEKAMLASQRTVTAVAGKRTKHIAASLRSADQVAALAGIDVYTMPTKVAADATKELSAPLKNQIASDPQVTFATGVDSKALRIDTLWDISEGLANVAKDLDQRPPKTPQELVDRLATAGYPDIFPPLTAAEIATISKDGKIPKHATWAKRIASGELAIDTLLNLAALQSFTADQAEMDARIRKYL